MKPIVKWAGGKSALADTLVGLIPYRFGHYYEPYFGGGALFCAVQPERATIGDTNEGLMAMYKKVRDNPEDLCRQLYELETLYNNADSSLQEGLYYNLRTMYNAYKTDVPAVFLLLNKTGYNGLYRENRKGEYNVPFGKRQSVSLYSKTNIMEWSKALQHTDIFTPAFCCGDFEDTVAKACFRDFVFFDPPYYGTFCKYQGGGFSESDQRRLARLVHRLTEKGVYCMITNTDCDFIRRLYSDCMIRSVETQCSMNRGKKKEVIITNYWA